MSLKAVRIEKVSSHSTSGRLKICKVYDGKEYRQVVCGAGNVKEGMKTVYAPVGSTTPAGIEIQKAELRGILSEGMLCSARDLSISDESGIVDLPLSVKEGTLLKKIPTDYLSSVPWHSFRCVESFWQSSEGRLVVERNNLDRAGHTLLSKTYFDGASYLYRHFIYSEETGK